MASLQAFVVPFEPNLHKERKHIYKCRKQMKKEEASRVGVGGWGRLWRLQLCEQHWGFLNNETGARGPPALASVKGLPPRAGHWGASSFGPWQGL